MAKLPAGWRLITKTKDGITFTVELRELVQCKDCKHGEPCNEGDVYCNNDIGTFESPVHKPDWFCADGEPKEFKGAEEDG